MNWPTAFTIVSLCVAASLLLIVMVRESSHNLREWARLHDASVRAVTAAVVDIVQESLAPSMPPPPEPEPTTYSGTPEQEAALRAQYGDAAVDAAKERVSQPWYLNREPEHEEEVDPLDLSTPLDHFNPYGQLDDDPDNPQPPNEAYPEVEPQREGRAMSVPPGFDPVKQMQQDQEQADWIERGGLA